LVWIAWIFCAVVSVWSLFTAFNPPAVFAIFIRPWLVTVGIISHIIFILYLVLATFIISRQPANVIGWLLMGPCLVVIAVENMIRYLAGFQIGPPPASQPILAMVWISGWAWLAFITPLQLIPLFFPTGHLLSPRWRRVVYLAVGLCVFTMFWTASAPVFSPNMMFNLVTWRLANPIGFLPGGTILYGWVFIAIMVLLLSALSLASIAVRFRIASVEERAQMKWLLFGCSFFGLTYSPFLIIQLFYIPTLLNLSYLLFFLSLIGLPLSITIAILRYRLFEIDLFINRTLVYGTLTALVVGLNILVVGLLGTVFRTGKPVWLSIIATGLAAVLFQPLRGWLQRNVNRLMYGRRDEPVAVLSQLAKRLEFTYLPDEILPGLVDAVAQALKLPYAAVSLQIAGQFVIQAECGQAAGPCIDFPLIYQGQLIGRLYVSPRRPGETFNAADQMLLTSIARQAGAVAHAVKLTAALQQSRQQLVTAREEERRRLRRDLHDGLGPQMASQTLTIDAITKLLDYDPARARDLLSHLKTQSQAALQDIRRLVDGLRPPALDELGLVEAIREGARQYGSPAGCVEIVTDPTPLPALPAAVEVAVYRIIQEAVTNVIRHTAANLCTVQIMVQNQGLAISIVDDGAGFPAGFHYGVGLNSMRERTEELGGTIQFANRPEGGAQVQVWLPAPGDVK
jgi:signal transduction histidine kinase